MALRSLHLFAGAGGGILADLILGHRPVCAVEIEEYPRRVLVQRQRDGWLPEFPIWGDIRTFDGKPWRGRVEIIAGGFPCQDISAAGKGAGIQGKRSGLWSEMVRVVGEVRPRFVFVENSPLLVSRGLAVVIGDLAALGYDAVWGVVGAHHAGAPHKRNRCWVLACSMPAGERGEQREGEVEGDDVANAGLPGPQGSEQPGALRDERDGAETHGPASECGGAWWAQDPAEMGDTESQPEWSGLRQSEPREIGRRRSVDAMQRPTQPRLGRVAHGVAYRVDRLKAIGNGQVPMAAVLAWKILIQEFQQ